MTAAILNASQRCVTMSRQIASTRKRNAGTHPLGLITPGGRSLKSSSQCRAFHFCHVRFTQFMVSPSFKEWLYGNTHSKGLGLAAHFKEAGHA